MQQGASAASGQHGPRPTRHFVVNVLWNWLGVGASWLTGLFLSPYIIRKLGVERYGVWALAFAMIEYVALFDLGLRSSIVNFVSRFRAGGQSEGINEVLNTAICYLSSIAAVVIILAAVFHRSADRFFQISPAYLADFSTLILLVAVTYAIGMVCSIFPASLEAFQEFKLYNHVAITAQFLRGIGCVVLLYFGYGLIAMCAWVVMIQIWAYAMNLLAFRKVFPALQFSIRHARFDRFKEMSSYGFHSFLANSSSLVLNQGPSVLVGHFRPEAFVGYFALPSRLLMYSVDAILRIGFVTAPKTAELVALGRRDQVMRFGVSLNRYCFALFLPLSIFLLVYGRELITVWLGAGFAIHSAPLLLPFVLCDSLALAGQYNSSSILFGLAKHRHYAYSVMLEAALLIAGLMIAIPRSGILGAAWVVAVLMIASRGLGTAWILCRHLNFSFPAYLYAIYARPLLIAAAVFAGAWWLKLNWIAGENWRELCAAMAVISIPYGVLSILFCLEPEHRAMVVEWVRRHMP